MRLVHKSAAQGSPVDARAIVDPGAELADSVRVGPFATIGRGVIIGPGTTIGSHVVLEGPTVIGRDNEIHPFATVGGAPQDLKYQGEDTQLELGDRNIIREYCTISRGTVDGGGVTRIGSDNLFMAYVHIAHDCQIGSHTVFANCASLGGHVVVDDYAVLAGFAIVHQFCRIGEHSFCGMGSAIARDVVPFCTVAGHSARPCGINSEGLRRRGFDKKRIQAIKRAYRLLYRSGLRRAEAIDALQALPGDWPDAALVADFVSCSARGIVR